LDLNVRTAARFVAKGGILAIFKTATMDAGEARDGIKAARDAALHPFEPHQYELSLGGETMARQIVLFQRSGG
jgi:hypothetical protein